MSKTLFKIWCSKRIIKKSFSAEPKLPAVIEKGKKNNINHLNQI